MPHECLHVAFRRCVQRQMTRWWFVGHPRSLDLTLLGLSRWEMPFHFAHRLQIVRPLLMQKMMLQLLEKITPASLKVHSLHACTSSNSTSNQFLPLNDSLATCCCLPNECVMFTEDFTRLAQTLICFGSRMFHSRL